MPPSPPQVAYRAARATAWSTVPAVFLVTLFAQLGWQQLANLRLVCAAWRSVHDAMVPRLWPRSVFPGTHTPPQLRRNEPTLAPFATRSIARLRSPR